MKKILITDPVDGKCPEILKSQGFAVDIKTGISADDLKSIIADYNALIVRSETKVDASLISLMGSMEVIGRAGAGTDNIDINAATHKGILVMNAPGGNTISAAEHTLALILSVCRNIPQANASFKEKKWERKKFTGVELFGKTLFIIGYGKIGREVALRSISFGMKVLVYDPVINPANLLKSENINFVSFEEGLKQADIITLHVPLVENTKNMISAERLKLCRQGVKIINCARGGIINENDLAEAIKSGKVSSAAIDVFEKEPPDFNSELFSFEKVICTPHLGASTSEAQEKVGVQIAEQISGYFKNGSFQGSVNIPFGKIDERLKRYLDLAENLGYLHSKIISSGVKEIRVSLTGDYLHSNSSVIKAAVLKGFLKEKRAESINLINAPVLISESGISVSEIKVSDDENYNNLIRVSCFAGSEERVIAGTIFNDREARVVKIDDYLVEFNPEGEFIIYYNIDKPGVLASVSNLLAEKGYNISGVFLGRNVETGTAISILGIDGKISGDVKKIISGINGILYVYSVRFPGR